MNFMMYESGGRHRKRQAERKRRIVLGIILLFAMAAVCYWRGREAAISEGIAYKQEYAQCQTDSTAKDQKLTELQSQVQSAQVRYQQLDAKYKTEVPQGDFGQIAALVKKQLDSGIKPERLSFVIEAARPPRNCTEPQVKRFVMKTPVYNGPQGAVSFGNGVVTVAGEGSPSVDPSGKAEAWYDPGKPVEITFTEIGGQNTVKKGLLPIQHSIVIGNKEYRFTVAAGERSFISVTSDSCDYP
jgi:hypothetical protein